MSVVGDLLRDARALLEKGRSEKYEAVDGDDQPIDPSHKDAAKFSVWGALTRAARDRGDSTGLDTAMVYLGVDNIQDPELRGFNTLEDDKLYKRWDEATERAEGGPIKNVSVDAERRSQKAKSQSDKLDATQAGRKDEDKDRGSSRAKLADPNESK